MESVKKAAHLLNKSLGRKHSVELMPEKELETKFVNLSLAFKTDKDTLDQRISVQKRARDLAEQNVDKELQGLREAVEVMSELVQDTDDDQVRDVLQRIKRHIDVLEQAAARVSSNAEVFGAVQQERRMCKAMEVMVLYTENLRRIREREETELEEARKILTERSGPGFNTDFESSPTRRSMSVCGFNAGGRQMRRRSEVALPRVLGGSGSPSLTPTSSLDPKSRFQSAVACTSIQNAITTTMKKVSLERRRSGCGTTIVPTPIFSLTTPSDVTSSRTHSESESSDKKGNDSRRVSTDEDAFRKGFEEGLKAQLSTEFNTLREQQNSISESLEQVMDRVEQASQEDETVLDRCSKIENVFSLVSRAKEFVTKFDWKSNQKIIRNFTGVLFVLFAVLVVFLSPPVPAVEVQHFGKPPQ